MNQLTYLNWRNFRRRRKGLRPPECPLVPPQSTTTSTATTVLPSSKTEDEDDEGAIEKRSSSTSIHTQQEGALKMVMKMLVDRLWRARDADEGDWERGWCYRWWLWYKWCWRWSVRVREAGNDYEGPMQLNRRDEVLRLKLVYPVGTELL